MPKILDIPTHMKGLRGERKKGVLYYTFIMLESIFHFTNGYNIFLENYFNTSKTPFPRHVFQNNISICLLVCKILKTLKYCNQLIFMLATRVVFVPLTKVLVESSKKNTFLWISNFLEHSRGYRESSQYIHSDVCSRFKIFN